jgi:hypothetical protein
MKCLIVGFLYTAALATSLPCQAGDNSTDREKKPAKTSVSAKHHTIKQTGAAQTAHSGTAFCRRGDYYCIRAAASPWWPNAPGD